MYSNPLEAKTMFHETIVMDPNFTPAYTEIAGIWIRRGFYNGDLNAQEVLDSAYPYLDSALKIDREYDQTYLWQGIMKLVFQWDFKGAEKAFEIAQVLNPADPGIVPVTLLLMQGKYEDALERAYKGFNIDPNLYLLDKGLSHFFIGELDKANEVCDQVIQYKFPNILKTGQLLLYLERYDELISLSEKWIMTNDPFPFILGSLIIAYDRTNNREKANLLLEQLKKSSIETSVGSPAFYTARIYAARGQSDLAFKWLKKAFANHEVEMVWLNEDPLFKGLYHDPRWKEIIEEVGFNKL